MDPDSLCKVREAQAYLCHKKSSKYKRIKSCPSDFVRSKPMWLVKSQSFAICAFFIIFPNLMIFIFQRVIYVFSQGRGHHPAWLGRCFQGVGAKDRAFTVDDRDATVMANIPPKEWPVTSSSHLPGLEAAGFPVVSRDNV